MDYTKIIEQINDVAEHASNVGDMVSTLADNGNNLSAGDGISNLGKYLGAAFSMLGALGVGASQGYAAGTAAAAVGRNPEAQPKILNTMIVGMAITEAVAIYSFIVAILIVFVA